VVCFFCEWEHGAVESVLESNGYKDGRVAQLGEHLLCKHAFISPKSLNRHLFTVQTPLIVGLPIGLQKIPETRFLARIVQCRIYTSNG